MATSRKAGRDTLRSTQGDTNQMEKIVSLAKQRGFVYPNSEIYGGMANAWDYGPLGVELKNNVKKAWWYDMVQTRRDVVGLDSAVISNPHVWEASGHTGEGFSDPLTECKNCHNRYRADKLDNKEKCPNCGGELMPARKFNILMKTFIGPVEDSAAVAYLRGETAQPIYVDFKLVQESSRQKVPFGIAQIGKAFRNEITPGNFTFRTREFEQMEMQFFVKPGENEKWFKYWRSERMNWYLALGMKKESLHFYEQKKNELAHYAKAANDIYFAFPFGDDEIEGIHNRGEWDLSNHTKHSGKDLSYFDDESKEKFIPNVIETSAGADRATLAFLLDAYNEETLPLDQTRGKLTTQGDKEEKRVVLKFHPKLAPIKVAVLPLVRNKEKITGKALEIYDALKTDFMCQYDEAGSIGKRYRRQDEIGTPLCVTVDFDTLEDDAVTVRDRDSMKQERIKIAELSEYVKSKMA